MSILHLMNFIHCVTNTLANIIVSGFFVCVFFRKVNFIKLFCDNNLSFSFTDDGRIAWKTIRYTGYCETISGYTTESYISSGQTGVLCSGGTSNDFNITITFKRNKRLVN